MVALADGFRAGLLEPFQTASSPSASRSRAARRRSWTLEARWRRDEPIEASTIVLMDYEATSGSMAARDETGRGVVIGAAPALAAKG
jgi:hypothetical protein